MNAEADNFFPVSDPDYLPLENSVLYTVYQERIKRTEKASPIHTLFHR